MKTLSSIKPRERILFTGENKTLHHERKCAVVEDNPFAAAELQLKITTVKKEIDLQYKEEENDRQYGELLKLSEASNLGLQKALSENELEKTDLKLNHEKTISELIEVQKIDLNRLKMNLAKQQPSKTQSCEYIGLQKEFHKLMALKEFEKAQQVQKLMLNCKNDKMDELQKNYDNRCEYQINQLLSEQSKEMESLKQKHLQHEKDMAARQQQKIFALVQNFKNSKNEMLSAHQREFINFKKNNVDKDLVKHRQTMDGHATFRGSQKLEQITKQLQ